MTPSMSGGVTVADVPPPVNSPAAGLMTRKAIGSCVAAAMCFTRHLTTVPLTGEETPRGQVIRGQGGLDAGAASPEAADADGVGVTEVTADRHDSVLADGRASSARAPPRSRTAEPSASPVLPVEISRGARSLQDGSVA